MLFRTPTLGLNGQVPATALDPRNAAKGTQNAIYEYGLVRTPWGIAKLDLSAGLNSGDKVLAVFQWHELDRTSHLMAVTSDKIYDHDRVNNDWDDKTQAGLTMSSNIDNPVSFVECGHDDTAIYLNDDAAQSKAYHHVIVCDGGLSNIQRWAGRYETDFADLTGGGDYHDGTTHRAQQVSLSSKNRLILLSPREYSSSAKRWVEKNQRFRCPTIGKIQTWTGTGSGFWDMYDTGGVNLWAAPLGSDHIIYQTRGIWTINYVGGTAVFDPRPLIPDLGLLAPHAITSYNNAHYFVGTDYNVHAYYGGSAKEIIGYDIQKYLIEDLYTEYESRTWVNMSPDGKFLWILIVGSSSGYITRAYVRNMITGAWTVRDLASAFSSGGVTSITLAGSTTFVTGQTYAEALDLVSLYDDTVGDATKRYADDLLDSSRTLAADYATGVWSAGGYDYSLAAENFDSDFTENDMLVLFDPSATNTPAGNHYYTVYDVSANGFSIWGTDHGGGDHGVGDTSTSVPADLSVAGADTIGFYSVCAEDDPGLTYNELMESVKVDERLVLGDSAGYVYQVDETNTTDDGNAMDCRHVTGILDWERAHVFKRHGGFGMVAEGSADGAMMASYRVGNFDTSDTGWVDFSADLSTESKSFMFYPNVTSKKIQYKFADFSGKSFKVTELQTQLPVVVEDNR